MSFAARSVIFSSSLRGMASRAAIFFMTARQLSPISRFSSPLPILEYCKASIVMSLYASIELKTSLYWSISCTSATPTETRAASLTEADGRPLPKNARCSLCRQSLTLTHSGSLASGSANERDGQMHGSHR